MTGEQALLMLKGLVLDKGADFRYVKPGDGSTCVNFWDGQPSCIVGHVLDRMGPAMAPIMGNDANEWGIRLLHQIMSDWENWDWEFTSDAVRVLETAQEWQDMGWPWGVAVQMAEKTLADGRQVFCDEFYVAD